MFPIFVLVCFVMFLIGVRAAFVDVPETHEYFDAIEYVQQEGIVSGYSDGTYKPERELSRAEFTKIVMNAKFDSSEVEACVEVFFPDVGEDHKFKPYVCVAKTHGIIDGFSDGTYKPDDNITFAAAAKIIANAFELGPDLSLNTEESKFKGYVKSLEQRKAIPMSIDSLDSLLNRGEMAEIGYRLELDIENKDSKTYEELVPQEEIKICSKDFYNCGDFAREEDAQRVLDFCKAQVGKDIHRLDGDGDGGACNGSWD